MRWMGLFATGSGGNEESTAEDINYWFGVMMWCKECEDSQLLAIGRVMTGLMAASAPVFGKSVRTLPSTKVRS